MSGVLVSPLFSKPTYHPVQRETSGDLASCLLFFTSRPFYMPGTGLSPERLLRGTNHAALAHSPTFPAPLNHPSPGRWDRPELYSSLSQKYGQPIFAPALSLSLFLSDSLSFPLLAQAKNLVLPPLLAVCSQPPRLSVPRLAAGAGRLRFLYSV